MQLHPAALTALRLCLAAGSLLFALGISEAAATLLRRGAFPYLNIFKADPIYGVTLPAGAHTRLKSRTGRITDIRINAQGFRGHDWSTLPATGRVMVLGDSQVFGYGVPEEKLSTEQLSLVTGGRLHGLAAAVPTWGPAESVIAARSRIPLHRPEHVVFVANVSNDWVESPVPNHRRTTERDGWSTRVVTTIKAPTDFPFRRWFMSQSHLVFSVREVWSRVTEPTHPPAETALRVRRELASLSRGRSPHESIMTAHVLSVRDVCAASGCTVSVVILPLDVQVHPSEWRKYRTAPTDMGDIQVLADALSRDLRNAGIDCTDLLEPLRAASPGAFLPDDDHLSEAGHLVVARVIAGMASTSVAGVTP